MRALEPLVPRAFGKQLAVEGLLAVWADNHLRIHVPITRKPHVWFRQRQAAPGMTSICFAVAAMSVIGLTIHLFVPGAG
jgi:hypothetical protein